MSISAFNTIPLCPQWMSQNMTGFVAPTAMNLDASNEKLGIKYYPSTTSPITGIDMVFLIIGAPGSFRIGVFSDSSDVPNDAGQLGGYSGTFAAPAASGSWIGIQTLASNTGNLTINTPVWIVIQYVSGTLDTSNYIQTARANSGYSAMAINNRELFRHHNGTNWTTTTSVIGQPCLIIKHADGSYVGFPLTIGGALARTAQNDIYVNTGVTQTQGVRFKAGSQIKVMGVRYLLTKTGTPNGLTWTVYEGDISKYSQTEIAANVISGRHAICWFASPVLLAADTNLFILATQTGTSDSNDYDLQTWIFVSTYLEAVAESDFRFVYGNGATPSALTVSTTELPFCVPIIGDPSTDLDMSAGGGLLIHPSMTGGING